MSNEKKSKNISRRTFLKNFGTGVVGSTVVISGIQAAPQQKVKAVEPPVSHKIAVTLTVNGKEVKAMVEPRTTLAEFLRDELNLTGTKIVCNHGECGSCTVVMNGKAVYSCQMLALDAAGQEIITIEGLLTGEELHPLQAAFVEHDGLQCGFCTPGQIMAAYALLQKHPKPTREQIITGMSGNLCRCAAYPKILDSVTAAVEKM